MHMGRGDGPMNNQMGMYHLMAFPTRSAMVWQYASMGCSIWGHVLMNNQMGMAPHTNNKLRLRRRKVSAAEGARTPKAQERRKRKELRWDIATGTFSHPSQPAEGEREGSLEEQ